MIFGKSTPENNGYRILRAGIAAPFVVAMGLFWPMALTPGSERTSHELFSILRPVSAGFLGFATKEVGLPPDISQSLFIYGGIYAVDAVAETLLNIFASSHGS